MNIRVVKRLIRPLTRLRGLKAVPSEGYTVFQLLDGKDFEEYITEYSKKLSIVVLYSHTSTLKDIFQLRLAQTPLGHPEHVTVAYLAIEKCPRKILEAYRICAVPTSLLFLNRKMQYKVVGIRTNEIGIKSRFALRNAGLNPCAW